MFRIARTYTRILTNNRCNDLYRTIIPKVKRYNIVSPTLVTNSRPYTFMPRYTTTGIHKSNVDNATDLTVHDNIDTSFWYLLCACTSFIIFPFAVLLCNYINKKLAINTVGAEMDYNHHFSHPQAVHIYMSDNENFNTFDAMIKYMPEIDIVIHINSPYNKKDLRSLIKKYLCCAQKKNIHLQINGATILHFDNNVLVINCDVSSTDILSVLLVKESATLLFKLLEKINYSYGESQPCGGISEIKLVNYNHDSHSDFHNLLKKKYRVSFD